MTRMNLIVTAVLTLTVTTLSGQYRTDAVPATGVKSDTSAVVITLDDALKIALSENVAVKVADLSLIHI